MLWETALSGSCATGMGVMGRKHVAAGPVGTVHPLQGRVVPDGPKGGLAAIET